MPDLTFHVKYHPQPWSVPVLQSPARYRWVAGGRRLGKTHLLAQAGMEAVARFAPLRHQLWHDMGRHEEPYMGWVVGPSYKIVLKDWNVFRGACAKSWYKARQTDPKQLYFPAFNAYIEFVSADHPDDLVSEGLDFLLLDECGLLSEEAWMTVQPSLSERKGWVLGVGRPMGAEHWYYEAWLKGQPGTPEVLAGESASWRFDSTANPLFPVDEWERQKSQYPPAWFDQEFRGEFLKAGSAVFPSLDHCLLRSTLRSPITTADGQPGERGLVTGVDVGQHKAHTSCVTMDANRAIVDLQQWTGDTTTSRKNRIIRTARRWRSKIVVDSTLGSIGHDLEHDLRGAGMRVMGVSFNPKTKAAMILAMCQAIEEGTFQVGPADHPTVARLIQEFKEHQLKTTRRGVIQYQPPSGKTCDLLTGCYLANWGVDSGWAGGAVDVGHVPGQRITSDGRVVEPAYPTLAVGGHRTFWAHGSPRIS